MTMTPFATIADALIDFILSLLHDPAAAEEYEADPEGTLDRAGLGGACLADVRSVAPVIYDNPAVIARGTHQPYVPTGPGRPDHPQNPVQQAISNIVNNFSVDNRATLVDQSINQNIWAEGDVTQDFDKTAIINTGDGGAAAGHDADVDHSATTVGGDFGIGNTTNNTTVEDSFNDSSSTDNSTTEENVSGSYNENTTTVTTDTVVQDSFNDASDDSTTVDQSDNSVTADVDDSSDVAVTVESAPEEFYDDGQP